jgi:hypothetical protein
MIKITSTYSAFGNTFEPLLILEEKEFTKIDPLINTNEDTFGQKEYLVVTVSKDKYQVTALGSIEVYSALTGIQNSRTVTITYTKDNVEQNVFNARITNIEDLDLESGIIVFDFVDEDSEIIQNNQDQTVKNTTHTKIELTLLDDIFDKSASDIVTLYTNLPILSDVGEPNLITSTDTGVEILFHADLSRTKVTRLYLSESEKNEFLNYVYSSSIKLTPVTDGVDGTALDQVSYLNPTIDTELLSNQIYSVTLTITTEVDSSNNINT